MRRPITHLVIGTRLHADGFAIENGIRPDQVLSTSQGDRGLQGLDYCPELVPIAKRGLTLQDSRALEAYDQLERIYGKP